jgi:hypothetical protein
VLEHDTAEREFVGDDARDDVAVVADGELVERRAGRLRPVGHRAGGSARRVMLMTTVVG